MKSWTMTLWRFTRPMPPMVRWAVRLTYTLPLAILLAGAYFTTDFTWYIIGVFVGGMYFMARAAIRSWLRRYSVALVNKRRTR